VAPAAPTIDPRERAAVARYFEEVEAIAGDNMGTGDPETMAMALLSQATGGDWGNSTSLATASVTRCGGCEVFGSPRSAETTIGRWSHCSTLAPRSWPRSGRASLGALSTLTRTSQQLQTDAEATSRSAHDIRQRYGL
jgi:hypothetical protein